jgi:hypothetical protein
VDGAGLRVPDRAADVVLPGCLADEERWAIAEVLKETGLFTIEATE